MYRYIILIIFVASSTWMPAWADNRAESMLDQLDSSLEHRDVYEKAKLREIEQLYVRLSQTGMQPEQRYRACMDLYETYKSYKYDSAYVYADQSLQLAQQLANPNYLLESHTALTFCLLSAGLYKEAFDEIGKASTLHVAPEYLKKYYWTQSRLYYDMADYNPARPYQDEYVRIGGLYTDSLQALQKRGSSEWVFAEALRQMKEWHYDECVPLFQQLLGQPKIDLHDKAVITSCLGWISVFRNDAEQAVSYLAQAAICDNETATKETTALCVLAGHLYEQGDVARAIRYVQLSLDDANFYNARQRKIETGKILPIIEQDRYQNVRRQRNLMLAVAGIAALFVAGLLAGVLFIRRQMKMLQAAQRTIEERSRSLLRANEQLLEANKIKNEYIGKSFYINAEYIEKVERLYKMVDRKVMAGQYEDLRSSIRNSTLIAERKSMYAVFDETFLTLFPHFVERFNQLFEEKDRRLPDNGQSLTTEMRIFALIRLGVTDSDRIARFLNYSIHTINTYKTRVKNKSVVENDQFEQRIMEI